MNHSKPYRDSATSKKDQVEKMFNLIAQNYDLANKALSVRIDRLWRKKAVRLLAPYKPRRILDIGTGTGDFAIAFLRLDPQEITGMDIAEKMIAIGEEKVRKMNKQDIIRFCKGAAEKLPFEGGSFDAVVSAFGFRNFEDREKNLEETYRTLADKGVCLILEFSQPKNVLSKWFYSFYLHKVVPQVGGMISGHKQAYEYLNNSIHTFLSNEQIIALMRSVGFKNVRSFPQSGGICRIWVGEK